MIKAYDLSDLVGKLKSEGLDIAEEAAKKIIKIVPDWLIESAKLSATPIDDVAVSLLPHLQKTALEIVDKIDGQVG